MHKYFSQEDGKKFILFVKNIILNQLNKYSSINENLIDKINLLDYKKIKKSKEIISKINGIKNKHGVFVTIKKNGNLRGCIGYPYPILSLDVALEKAAISAAFFDHRFNKIDIDEFFDLDFEISILSIPEEIKLINRKILPSLIEIGKHGLIIELGENSGLLLPIVAVEFNLSSKNFLEQVCIKAGLFPNSWLDEKSKIFFFETQIFSD